MGGSGDRFLEALTTRYEKHYDKAPIPTPLPSSLHDPVPLQTTRAMFLLESLDITLIFDSFAGMRIEMSVAADINGCVTQKPHDASPFPPLDNVQIPALHREIPNVEEMKEAFVGKRVVPEAVGGIINP